MEIAFALAGLLAISLIVVPRLRRRGGGRVRANAGKQWTASHAARRRGASGRAAGSRLRSRNPRTAAVAAGAGGTGVAYPADADLDWDDALGWGADTAVADPPAPVEYQEPATNGNGNGAVTTDPPAAGNDAAPAPVEEPLWDDWAEPDEPATEEEPPAAPEPTADAAAAQEISAPAQHRFTSDASPPADDAPEPAPADWDWDPEPAPAAEASDEWDWEPVAAPAPSAAAPARRERDPRRKFSPLVLVAMYAAAGIGAIVIGISLFTGEMEDKGGGQPAKKTSASATVEPTASPTPAPVSTPTAAERAEATKLKQAYDDQRAAVLGQETRAVRKVQTAARKARARRRAP